MDIHAGLIYEEYKTIKENWMSAIDKKCNKTVKNKLVHNSMVTDLVFINIVSLDQSIVEYADKNIGHFAIRNFNELKALEQNDAKLKKSLDNLDFNCRYEKDSFKIELDKQQNKLEMIAQSNSLLYLQQDMLTILHLNAVNSVKELFTSTGEARNKEASKKLVNFIIGLEPFVSGTNAIIKIFENNIPKQEDASSFFDAMDSYWKICFLHSIAIRSLIESLTVSYDIREKKCVDCHACFPYIEAQYKALLEGKSVIDSIEMHADKNPNKSN